MAVLRRLVLIAVVLVVPVVAVALLYEVTIYVLAHTQRTIEPGILRLASGVEYAAFLFITLIEAKNRW